MFFTFRIVWINMFCVLIRSPLHSCIACHLLCINRCSASAMNCCTLRIKAGRWEWGRWGGCEAVMCFHRGVLSLGKCNRLEYQWDVLGSVTAHLLSAALALPLCAQEASPPPPSPLHSVQTSRFTQNKSWRNDEWNKVSACSGVSLMSAESPPNPFVKMLKGSVLPRGFLLIYWFLK